MPLLLNRKIAFVFPLIKRRMFLANWKVVAVSEAGQTCCSDTGARPALTDNISILTR